MSILRYVLGRGGVHRGHQKQHISPGERCELCHDGFDFIEGVRSRMTPLINKPGADNKAARSCWEASSTW